MASSLLPLILHYGLPLVALMLFAGEIGVPTVVPMEIALLLAGAYAVHSLPELLLGLALVTAADLSGTTILYWVARTGGVRLLTRLLHRHEARQTSVVERWRRRLGGHDAAVVFFGRLLPLVRMYVAIGVGLLRIPVRHFLLGAAPAALLWAGTPLVLGYLFRANVQQLAARYTLVSHMLLLAFPAVGLIGLLVWWVCRAHFLAMRIRRVRFVLGLMAALGGVAYLLDVAWANEAAVDRGMLALPLPLLVFWLCLLGAIAVTLLWQALADLRLARAVQHSQNSISPRVGVEVAITLGWLSLVAAGAGVVIGIDLYYPAL